MPERQKISSFNKRQYEMSCESLKDLQDDAYITINQNPAHPLYDRLFDESSGLFRGYLSRLEGWQSEGFHIIPGPKDHGSYRFAAFQEGNGFYRVEFFSSNVSDSTWDFSYVGHFPLAVAAGIRDSLLSNFSRGTLDAPLRSFSKIDSLGRPHDIV